MDVYWYASRYNLSDQRDLVKIRDDLERDFVFAFIGSTQASQLWLQFSKFQNTVFELMQKIDKIFSLSNERLDVDLLWRDIFYSKIVPLCIKYYPAKCSPDFLGFANRYKDLGSLKRKKTVTQVEYDESLVFMNLKKGYSYEDLIKRYRELSLVHHPDKGGSSEMFINLTEHMNILRHKLNA